MMGQNEPTPTNPPCKKGMNGVWIRNTFSVSYYPIANYSGYNYILTIHIYLFT